MKPPTATDRLRLGRSLYAIYRDVGKDLADLLDAATREAGCSRRQLERVFQAFRTSPAVEIRKARAHLVMRCLAGTPGYTGSLAFLARQVGYSDARAMRRDIRWAWGMSPAELREAGALQRQTASWGDAVSPSWARPSLHYRRAWEEANRARLALETMLDPVPRRTREALEAAFPSIEPYRIGLTEIGWHREAVRLAHDHLEELRRAARESSAPHLAA